MKKGAVYYNKNLGEVTITETTDTTITATYINHAGGVAHLGTWPKAVFLALIQQGRYVLIKPAPRTRKDRDKITTSGD